MSERNYDKFRGTLTALLTPMDEHGEIDFASLIKSVKHQLDGGARGFYVGGSTGEGFLLTEEERMSVLETVAQANEGRGTIVAHIGCMGTRDSIRLARHAESVGADAISAVVPFYYKLSMRQIQEHYEAIMAAVSTPMIIYHFPGATGVSLTLDFYTEMARNPQCIGLKFTSLNLFELEQIRANCGSEFLLFNGHDEVYAGGALLGADGAIGSTFNLMPGLYAEMHAHARAGRWEQIRGLQVEANVIIRELIEIDVLACEKYIMYLQGVFRTPTIRRPLKQLSDAERERMDAFFRANPRLQGSSYRES